MKEKNEKKMKINVNTYFPPFLEGFNTKRIKSTPDDNDLEVVTPIALELLQKISFDNESTSETIVRVIENYLLLISLAKVYQMLFYDAIKNELTDRLDKLKPDFMRNFSGYNAPFLEELDMLIGHEIIGSSYKKMIKTKVEEPKRKIPFISNKTVLPALTNVSYDKVLERIVQKKVFPPNLSKVSLQKMNLDC